MALRRRFTQALVSDKLFARPRADPRVLFRTLLQSSAALARRCADWFAGLTQRHLRPLQPLCLEVILLPANTRHPALVISLSTDAIVLRVFRPGLRDPAEALLRLFGIDKQELVQVALLQIHDGDGAYLSVLLGSLIGVSSVHFCLICSV